MSVRFRIASHQNSRRSPSARRRRSAVGRIRSQYRALARMRLWLLVHVPLSLALLVALVGHIVAVFIYW